MTVVGELRISPMFRSIKLNHHTALAPKKVDARPLTEGAQLDKLVAGE